jgi:two-component system LytT family sensor kinase
LPEQPLVILLVKVAVAASLASLLVRFRAFKRILLTEERSIYERAGLALSLAAVFGGGLVVRLVTKNTYMAADVGLEGCLIAGLVGGYVPGLLCGVLISIPAMFAGEMLSMPLFAAVGVLGGMVRDAAPDPEEVWSFSPFLDRNIYRVIRDNTDRPTMLFRVWFLIAIVLAEAMRFLGTEIFKDHAIFSLYPPDAGHPGLLGAVWLSTMFAVLLPIKIWANARTEIRLEEQRRLAQEARLRALTSQINPHFLFNTLNSITSLVRTNPDAARQVILKLSSILRRLLRRHDNFTTLREELAFVDDYLSIEMVRFGDKLRFVKEVEEEARDAMVPSMVLQPIIENSLKHGLSGKVEGGTIRFKAWQSESRLHLLIEDDGVGIAEANLAKLFEQGIGISNVKERLQVLFGTDYKMWIDSKPGEGTRTGIEIPSRARETAAATATRRGAAGNSGTRAL